MYSTIEKKKVKTFRDLNVYQQSFDSAMEIFRLTSKFPPDERYTLIDQMRRASRSIPANLAEGWAKRNYINVFKKHVQDSIGSCEEMKVWLDFSLKCGYLNEEKAQQLQDCYAQIGAMLFRLIKNWKTF